ncbi:MAG: efflux RND transporter periplasmic adaptor subunit [Chloroflexi bacterium]|nr:efflux RND transporter periplasmic adaptor subunit [Chloroflexota bacterium]
MKRWMFIPIIVGVVALVVGAGYLGSRSVQAEDGDESSQPQTVPVTRGDVQQTVTAPGQLVGTRQAMLSFPTGVSGRLTEINVRPGDRVSAGQTLARLETVGLEQAVAEAELDMRRARLRLEQLQEPADDAAVRRAQHTVDQAADELGVARIALDGALNSPLLNETMEDTKNALQEAENWLALRQRQHEEEGLDHWFVDQAYEQYEDARLELARVRSDADQQLESTRGRVSAASQTHQEAQDALQQLLEGTDLADLEMARLEVEAAELALESVSRNLEMAALVAPFDGVVLDVRANLGEKVSPGADLALLADLTSLEAEMEVIEEDLPLVQVGQPAELYFDALPDVLIQGQVARIVPLRISDERPLYAVYITLDEVPQSLAPGMTVDASFVIDARSDVLRLPRALVRVRSDGTATLQVWANGQIKERAVEAGLRGDVYVEILDGVREGEPMVAE